MTNRKNANSFALIAALTALSACAPQTRFIWGNYEPALYTYYKNPNDRASYKTALTAAIEAGRKANKVAPGLYAELGYMQFEENDLVAAKASFEEEIRLFPESKPFLSSVIQKISPPETEKKPIS